MSNAQLGETRRLGEHALREVLFRKRFVVTITTFRDIINLEICLFDFFRQNAVVASLDLN